MRRLALLLELGLLGLQVELLLVDELLLLLQRAVQVPHRAVALVQLRALRLELLRLRLDVGLGGVRVRVRVRVRVMVRLRVRVRVGVRVRVRVRVQPHSPA